MNLATQSGEVVELTASSLGDAGPLEVRVHIGRDEPCRAWFVLYDTRQGDGQTKLTINGQKTDRAALLAWFAEAKTKFVTLFQDLDRYGLVVQANFTEWTS